ncbi:hypothetical protein PTI45_03447 [Paenibacillus nuruki]|uniref:Uncharacterized protein n=1 Tax=Paenibacillus nuruki TaxID=1886670 RepID=A0A1E3L078_9BACL|nr:hypothetical protein [Paenibacillus nuruki]ODP27126.1 hypothetical protein PTI45_03447 [Paenibacillus nuruki]CAJ1315049.1 Conserved domain protein [Paenibacillus nuruki]
MKPIINNFSIHTIEWLSDLYFQVIQNKYFENTSILDITFLIKENGKTYELLIRFFNVEALRFQSGGTLTQISGFNIKDLTENGYYPMKYEVEDYENGIIHFYCDDIEFLSLTESEYIAI